LDVKKKLPIQKYMDGWEAPTAKSGDYHPEGKIVGVTRGTKKVSPTKKNALMLLPIPD
jgi:hypothetical protein